MEKSDRYKIYQEALGIVNPGACNLSGIAITLAEIVVLVRQELREDGRESSAAVARHPAVRLILHQMAFLATDRELLTLEEYQKAVQDCELAMRNIPPGP